MAKYRIPVTTWASGTIDYETDETDPERIYEAAMSDPETELPSVCAQCSGWGRSFSLEIGDEWEAVTDKEPTDHQAPAGRKAPGLSAVRTHCLRFPFLYP